MLGKFNLRKESTAKAALKVHQRPNHGEIGQATPFAAIHKLHLCVLYEFDPLCNFVKINKAMGTNVCILQRKLFSF